MIDTSVHLGHWPFRRHGYEELAKATAKLHAAGITEAWASSFEGIFHKDLAGVNARLAIDCSQKSVVKLVPFGTVNPKLPAWEDDLRRCHEVHAMPGIRLYPGYHGYQLDDARVASLLTECSQRKQLVQIVVKLEDERTQHPLMPVPSTDLKAFPELIQKFPNLRVQILNSSLDPRTEALVPLVRAGKVHVDFAMLESVGAMARLIERVGLDRVVLGSHFPLFHVESVLLKIEEAALKEAERKAVLAENARAMLRPL